MKMYQSYKSSCVEWIGDVPEHWKISRISRHFYMERGRVISKEEIYDQQGEYPVYSSQTENNGILGSIKTYDFEGEYVSWTTDGANAGTCFYRKGKFNTTNVCGLLSNKILGEFNLKFVNYYLNLGTKGYVRLDINPKLMNNMMGEIPIIIPSKLEQLQIVRFLDEKTELIDKLISTKEQKIILLKEQRTSLINEVITKGLNSDVKMKDTGVDWIGKIPEHWSMISIKHLVSTKITDGPHETPTFLDEGIPFLSVESVQDNKLDFERKRGYISKELHQEYSKKCKPKRDDIFIVKSGSTTGKSTIVDTDEEFNIWSPLCIIRSNKSKIIPRFTFASIQSPYFRKFVELGWSFGTQPNIGMGVIENIKLVVPPISEQQQIVEYLDTQTKEIDELVSMEQKKIDLLKEYRQSLISEVITGKIDVRTNPN